MQRTIEIGKRDGPYCYCSGDVFYQNQRKGFLFPSIRKRFKMRDCRKYVVSITESKTGKFTFVIFKTFEAIDIYEQGICLSWVCFEEFTTLFFEPDPKKSYNIKVRSV